MEVFGAQLGDTPVFEVPAPEVSDLKRVSYGVYDAEDGVWRFPAYFPFALTVYADLRRVAQYAVWRPEALDHLRAADEAAAVWGVAVAAWEAPEGDPLPDVPASFFPQDFAPYRHQRLGIARVRRWLRTWLLWEMGTGKTRTTLDGLRLLAAEGRFRKALVLGPPVVLPGWQRETRRVSGGRWRAVIWDGSPDAAAAARDAEVVLVTYTRAYLESLFAFTHPQFGETEIFAPERSPLLDLGYDTIVGDESHSLGNLDSKQTQATLLLSRRASRRILLTGTPGDTPDKIYAQMTFLAPWLMPLPIHKFRERYHTYGRTPGGTKILVGYQNLAELNAQVDAVAHRMKKSECLDLPPMTVVDVPFALGLRQQARYNEMVSEMRASTAPAFGYLTRRDYDEEENRVRLVTLGQDAPTEVLFQLPHGAARLNKLLQLVSGFMYEGVDLSVCDACPRMETCVVEDIKPYTRGCSVYPTRPKRKTIRDVENPKRDVFTDLLAQILAEDPTNKVLCWGCYDPELDDMEAAARKLGVGSVRLDGSTTGRISAIEDAIREDPSCRVLVGAISAAVGINLQRANYTIVYSMPWKPLQYLQALERNNRPGQTRKMTVYRLLTPEGSGVVDRMVEASFRFKERVGYTMVEMIACAGCPRAAGCSLDGTVPFSQNCAYASTVARPIAKVTLL